MLFSMTTQSFKTSDIQNSWILVDATNKTLGRLATKVAFRLIGKHKPEYTPHVDTGDYIVVVNAEKICVTGRKLKDKMYYKHTGYIGNLKKESLEHLMQRAPEKALERAVKGMLPRNPLGKVLKTTLRELFDAPITG